MSQRQGAPCGGRDDLYTDHGHFIGVAWDAEGEFKPHRPVYDEVFADVVNFIAVDAVDFPFTPFDGFKNYTLAG
jgi:hypothetical protein